MFSGSGSKFVIFHILYHKQKLDFAISTLQNRGGSLIGMPSKGRSDALYE